MQLPNIIILYHGSDHIVNKPLYGKGKKDNDYGQGFYTTQDKEKADEWALVNGTELAVTNEYCIETTGLNIINLDNYGQLAWIAEIIANRGTRGEIAKVLGDKIVENYRIDTTNVDIIIGYRADDSYIDVVDAFLRNEVSLEEVDRLFKKGNLGQQVFIKSEKAFNKIKFCGYKYITCDFSNTNEIQARIEVAKFLRNRSNIIQLNNYIPNGILARDVIMNEYIYNQEYQYYEQGEPYIQQEGDYE